MAVVQLLISLSLPSNGFTRDNILIYIYIYIYMLYKFHNSNMVMISTSFFRNAEPHSGTVTKVSKKPCLHLQGESMPSVGDLIWI
jgi:hypothetical protein